MVQDWLAFRAGLAAEVSDVPFQMPTDMALTPAQWARIAHNGSWQMLRQNLNTLDRHDAFAVPGVAGRVAAVLRDPARVGAARVLPYQLLATLTALSASVPVQVCAALHDAMELAVGHVPSLPG